MFDVTKRFDVKLLCNTLVTQPERYINDTDYSRCSAVQK